MKKLSYLASISLVCLASLSATFGQLTDANLQIPAEVECRITGLLDHAPGLVTSSNYYADGTLLRSYATDPASFRNDFYYYYNGLLARNFVVYAEAFPLEENMGDERGQSGGKERHGLGDANREPQLITLWGYKFDFDGFADDTVLRIVISETGSVELDFHVPTAFDCNGQPIVRDSDNDGISDTCDASTTPGSIDFDRDDLIDGTACDTTIGPPVDPDQCKNNGWSLFNAPMFRNQGQCVSFVRTGGMSAPASKFTTLDW